MDVYIYKYIHTYINTYVHIHIYIYICYIHTVRLDRRAGCGPSRRAPGPRGRCCRGPDSPDPMYIYIYNMCVYIYIYRYIHAHTYIHVIHTYMCVCIYIYIYIYILYSAPPHSAGCIFGLQPYICTTRTDVRPKTALRMQT